LGGWAVKFSKFNKLGASQGELDFVDIDPLKDKKLFVDPYAIQINALDEDDPFYDCLLNFFSRLLDNMRAGNESRIRTMVGHLHEPGDTFLGLSRGRPQGRGLGTEQAMAVVSAIRQSDAFTTGQLEDFSEAELFVRGVGSDKISDLATNVLRAPLAQYTQSICAIYGIPTKQVASAPIWNMNAERWESKYLDLPIVHKKPVLLVPKAIVRRRLCLDSQEYYNYYIDFLQAELDSTVGLASALRGASGRVTKKNVKEQYPFDKSELARFAREHPDLFQEFKKIMESADGISDGEIDPEFVYSEAALKLSAHVKNLPKGRDDASAYEKLIQSCMTLLFWPNLTFPIAQRPLHGGRKKIDIEFWNYAKSGFWRQMANDKKVLARTVPVECKNYTVPRQRL